LIYLLKFANLRPLVNPQNSYLTMKFTLPKSQEIVSAVLRN